jgi:predicted glycosyltransferase involved in capsule biosynthesis
MIPLVHVEDNPIFSLSRARNLGARQATGNWLMFSDADIMIDLPINEWTTKNSRWNEFYSTNPKRDPSLCGTAIINKVDFHVVGEYDEVFRGWGGEDLELYERLKKSSKTHKHINERYFSAIQHDDNIRQLSTEQGGIGTKKHALIAARIYTKIISGFYTNNKI